VNALKKIVKEAISILIVVALLAPAIIYVAPFLVGGSFSSVVMGGSMEPTIHVGSIVIVRKVKPEDVRVGDIVAFKTGESKTIHRVIEKVIEDGSFYFRTKGDANEDPDPWIVKPQDILGELQLTIPYYGYLIWFAQTPFGIVLFILVPAIILIANEVRNILKCRRGVKG
jgi:signal peptidase